MAMSPRESFLTPAQVLAWRQRLRLHQTEAANLLGLSRRNYINLEQGKSPVYKALVIAMWMFQEIATPESTYSDLKALVENFITNLKETPTDDDNQG